MVDESSTVFSPEALSFKPQKSMSTVVPNQTDFVDELSKRQSRRMNNHQNQSQELNQSREAPDQDEEDEQVEININDQDQREVVE